jgi:hypothetical protein
MIDNVMVSEYQPPALDVKLTARICWPTAEGLTYQIQLCTSPRLDTWENVGDPIGGSGGNLCITDDVTIGAASQFYRITLVP